MKKQRDNMISSGDRYLGDANKPVNKPVKLSKEIETNAVQLMGFRCDVQTGWNVQMVNNSPGMRETQV